jgi:hypothetical protein
VIDNVIEPQHYRGQNKTIHDAFLTLPRESYFTITLT